MCRCWETEEQEEGEVDGEEADELSVAAGHAVAAALVVVVLTGYGEEGRAVLLEATLEDHVEPFVEELAEEEEERLNFAGGEDDGAETDEENLGEEREVGGSEGEGGGGVVEDVG